MATAASSFLAAALTAAVFCACALAIVRAQRARAARLSGALARLGTLIDALSSELGDAVARIQRSERLTRALGEHLEWLSPAQTAASIAAAAAELAGAEAALFKGRDPAGDPIVAAVGIEAETEGSIGWPPGGTRAVALDFVAANGVTEFRFGLAVPIDSDGDPPAFLAVFWRAVREVDETLVADLEGLAARVRASLGRPGRPAPAFVPAVDELTGLGGRLAFHRTLSEQDGRFALLVVDVDDLGSLRDRIGLTAGDAILAEVAEQMRSSAAAEAIGCRIGDDRFGWILPDGAHADAERAFARLQAGLRRRARGEGTRVAVSAGIAVSAGEDEPLALLERAEEALRRAKLGAGGGAVVAESSRV